MRTEAQTVNKVYKIEIKDLEVVMEEMKAPPGEESKIGGIRQKK